MRTKADVFLAWIAWLTGQPPELAEEALRQQAGVNIRRTAFANEPISDVEFELTLAAMKRESPAAIFDLMRRKLPKLPEKN